MIGVKGERKMKTVYLTYDVNLKEYLKQNGFRYIICGLAPNEPHATFWVYERSDRFNAVLDKWIFRK